MVFDLFFYCMTVKTIYYRCLHLSMNTWYQNMLSCSYWMSNMTWLVIKHLKFSRLQSELLCWKSCSCQYFIVRLGMKLLSWKSISLKKSSMPNLSAISYAEIFVQKFTSQSAKLQMFDDQSCHVWYPIGAYFGITSSHLDSSNGSISLHLET